MRNKYISQQAKNWRDGGGENPSQKELYKSLPIIEDHKEAIDVLAEVWFESHQPANPIILKKKIHKEAIVTIEFLIVCTPSKKYTFSFSLMIEQKG